MATTFKTRRKTVRKLILFVSAVLLLVIGCDNELDVNADWKDVATVYGLLNPDNDTQWVRIGRTYLGDQGFAGGSQDPDSLYYKSIQVQLDELGPGGNVLSTTNLIKDETSRSLDSGFFTQNGYHLYRTQMPINTSSRYRLTVLKPDSLQTVTAETEILSPFDITRPRNNSSVNFTALNGARFSWDPTPGGGIYQGIIRFHYREQDRSNKGVVVQKYLDYPLPVKYESPVEIIYNIDYNTYFRFLSREIPETNDLNRFFDSIGFYVTAGTEEFATYIRVNQPSDGIAQDRPDYTNINNGIGIFASVVSTFREGLDLNPQTLDSLLYSDLMCGRRFGRKELLDTCYCVNGVKLCE